MRTLYSATDVKTGNRFQIEVKPDAKVAFPEVNRIPNAILVQDLFPNEDYNNLMTGKLDASEYIQSAINESWEWVMYQYKNWEPAPGINYPRFQGDKTAWPRSAAASGIPIVMPPATLTVSQSLHLPQCVPIHGAGFGMSFDASKIFFRKGATLNVYGNLQSEHGPFQGIMGTLTGVKFIPGGTTPVTLVGDLSNFKIRNCHFSSVGLRNSPMIHHVNGHNRESLFGKVLVRDNGGQTLKEVTIEGNQFEGGSAAMSLSGGLNVNITNNTILYANLGMELRNCHKVRITDNNILGTKEGEPIQVDGQAGIIAGGSVITVLGNQFLDLDLGCAIAGKENHVYLNDWTRTLLGNSGGKSMIKANWRCPGNFGPIQKGDKAPFAG